MAPKRAAASALQSDAGARRVSSRIASRSAPAAASSEIVVPAVTSGKPKEKTGPAERDAPKFSATDAKKKVDEVVPSQASTGATAPAEAPPPKSKGGRLAVGDALPSGLSLTDEEGKPVDVASFRKVVIFSYPKANTGGCTTQGQCYRDAYSDYKKAGYDVYGLSNDNPTPLKNWKEKQHFPYHLISDPKRALIGKLTGSTASTARSHFIVGADGKLALVSVGVKPKESSEAALKFVRG